MSIYSPQEAKGKGLERISPLEFLAMAANLLPGRQVAFCFGETGSHFIKDGRVYHLPKGLQPEMAWKSGISFQGRELADHERHVPSFGPRCARCGSRPICNGCDDHGQC